MDPLLQVILTVVGLILVGFVCFVAGFWIRKRSAESTLGSAEIAAENIIEEAKKTAEARSKEIVLEAKEETSRIRTEAEKESKERKTELQKQEKRLLQKEETMDRKLEAQEKKQEELRKKSEQLDALQQEASAALSRQQGELERISGMTPEQAKSMLIATIESEARFESAKLVRDLEAKARYEADKKAKDIVATVIQRCAVDHVAETTLSVVQLPSDEMKGRIIGREGRNIRIFESLTGVDVQIDDTPEALAISGFDPMRREVARIAL